MSKVLFVVEGQVDEIDILDKKYQGLLSDFSNDYEIVSFKTSIYELYDRYINGDYDDLVSYLVYEKGLKLEQGRMPKTAFSSVYLIFDFEPNYQKYSDRKIMELQSIFNDETGMGKLYINYPTVEAFYDFESLPDNTFLQKIISLENFVGNKYKTTVHQRTCIRKREITKHQFSMIMKYNFEKAQLMCESDFSKYIDYLKILEVQIKMKNNNKLYVLATLPLLLIDCYPDKYKPLINSRKF